MLGRPIGEERRQNRERDLDARIADPAPQPQHQPTDRDPPENFPRHDGGEHCRGLTERKCAGADRGYREAIQDQRGRVVRQPFAFEDDQNAPGELQSARDGERGHRVRRRNDGAQQESHRPRQPQQIMRHGGDRAGREDDAAHRQQRDRAQIESEFAPAHRHRGRIDDGRQHEQEHQLRGKLHARQARDERQHHPDEHQDDCVRDPQPRREDGSRGNHDQQQDQELDRRGHGPHRPARMARAETPCCRQTIIAPKLFA